LTSFCSRAAAAFPIGGVRAEFDGDVQARERRPQLVRDVLEQPRSAVSSVSIRAAI
jgi:hypothetical protein